MNIGFSLSPGFILGNAKNTEEDFFIKCFGSPEQFLRELKNHGITSIELRAVRDIDDPSRQLKIAMAIWNLGLDISIHAALYDDKEGEYLSQIYPSVSEILKSAPKFQKNLVLTVHAFSEKDGNADHLKNKTINVLKKWTSVLDKESYDIQFSLELNRSKDIIDPSVHCDGVLDMVTEVSSRQLGICFDMGHFYYNHINNLEKGFDVPDIDFLKNVNHTHIHGLNENRTHCSLMPEESLPLNLYISALKNINYKGIYNLEFSFDRFFNKENIDKEIFDSILKLKSMLS